MRRHLEDSPRMNGGLLRCSQPKERLRCETEKRISSKFLLRWSRQFSDRLQRLQKSWRRRLRQSRRLGAKRWRNYWSDRRVLRPRDNHEEDDLGQIRTERVLGLLSLRLDVQTFGPAAWRHSRRDEAELRTPSRPRVCVSPLRRAPADQRPRAPK
jgi:hypothetical protein